MIIAVIAGTAALWMALRLDSVWSTFIASLIAGVAVNGMHYTGMAAVQAHAAPGLVVSTADTASATAFLLPLILGLSGVGFIFSAIIALSPTAAEIVEESELMKRIGQSQAAQSQAAQSQATEPGGAARAAGLAAPAAAALPAVPGTAGRAGAGRAGQPVPAAPSQRSGLSVNRALALPGRPHIRTLDRSQEERGRVVRKNETTRSLALAPSSHGPAGHCCQAVSPL